MFSRLLNCLAVLAPTVILVLAPGAAVGAGGMHSPHSAEGCLDCHQQPHGRGEIPTIISPEGDDPHRVLNNTCSGCHPGDMPPYWLLIFPGESATPPPAPTVPSSRTTFPNPHDSMECGQCHSGQVSFDRKAGQERNLVGYAGDFTDFCQRCHDEVIRDHFPRGNVPVGNTTCLTCHQVHRPSYAFPALREDYYSFIRETQEINPHGGNLFCLSCHPNKPVAGEEPEFLFSDREMEKLCSRCHPGMDHHVVDQLSGKKTWKMDFLNYPLQDGKITCVTCHDPPSCADGGEEVTSIFLRGEPYPKMTDFCQNCHEERGWEKFNPHDQLNPNGEIIGRSCLFCHVEIPNPNGEYDVYSMEFNDDLGAICYQCHDEFPHPDVDHMVMPASRILANMKNYEERREVVLPLDFDGRLTCVTCHNPHERGLLVGPDSVGADEEHRLRLATFNEVCTPCHGRH